MSKSIKIAIVDDDKNIRDIYETYVLECSVIQEGSHDDLVYEDGKYKELWDAQAGYYV